MDTRRSLRCATAGLVIFALTAGTAQAGLLITEVIPGVNVTSADGDTVEIYNTGPGAVDLTSHTLSDMDNAGGTTLTAVATFTSAALAVPPLAAGRFAVITFRTSPSAWEATNFGLRIYPQATGSRMNPDNEQLVLADPSGRALDSVAWSSTSLTPTTDDRDDLATLTLATTGYFPALDADGAWAGPDAIGTTAVYRANTVDFSAYDGNSAYGDGVLRRKSVNGVWAVGVPDGPTRWEAADRTEATLGNFSDHVTTAGGYIPLNVTDDLTTWITELEDTTWPDRRIATGVSTNDYKIPTNADLVDWRAMLAKVKVSDWPGAFDLARPLGYEVVEFLDRSTQRTLYILRDRVAPGMPGYRGQGVFVFDAGLGSNPRVMLQAPHPLFDSITLAETAVAVPRVRPRATLLAGTHRNNATTVTLCDGELSPGVPYRISDPAHEHVNFFQVAHEEFQNLTTDTVAIQFHGFGGTEDSDIILSNGDNINPPATQFIKKWKTRLAAPALNFIIDDAGTPRNVTAEVYGEPGATSLGGTTNVQGRFTNGVACPGCCTVSAGTAGGRFVHIEQRIEVRQDPHKVVTALLQALDDAGLGAPPVPVAVTGMSIE